MKNEDCPERRGGGERWMVFFFLAHVERLLLERKEWKIYDYVEDVFFSE